MTSQVFTRGDQRRAARHMRELAAHQEHSAAAMRVCSAFEGSVQAAAEARAFALRTAADYLDDLCDNGESE